MPWEKTSLKVREERLRNGIASNLGLASTPGRLSNIGAMTAEIAGEVDDLHQHIDYARQQIHTKTCDEEHLKLKGARYSLPKLSATQAVGQVSFSGPDGKTISKDEVRLKHTSGVIITLDANATITDGTAVVNATAELAGNSGNLAEGELLSPISPIEGVSSEVTVSTAFTEGREEETLDAYRSRIMFREAFPPMGGNDADYVVWAKMINGVSDVWVYPKEMGLSTVTVRIAAYDDPTGPIPTEALRQKVADHIDGHINPVTGQWSGRNSGAEVFVVAPVPKVIDLDFSALVPDTEETRAAVKKAVALMLRKRSKPGVLINLDWIGEAISKAVGEDQHTLATPNAAVQCAVNELPVVGNVTVGGV
ncbi:MAG: baseplate J/gp47 family protein [Methylocystaceae bacterium]|nr:baseplate J/gp47 family protein [Methylocystaceae bacterium]